MWENGFGVLLNKNAQAVKKKNMSDLDRISERVSKNSGHNYNRISYQYNNSYSIPGLESLREEICICLTLNLFQAAITLTNHLFENGFKTLLILYDFYQSHKSEDIIDEMGMLLDKYDNKELSKIIETAFKNNIVDEQEKTKLKDLKNKFRNPFSHAEKRKIYGQEKSIVEEFKFGDNGIYIERQEHLKANLLPYHDSFQFQKAFEESFEYFIYIDKIIRKSYLRIFKKDMDNA
jgi:hypothetical protein